MATISICYGTNDGQTATVAEHIARVIEDLGHRAQVVDLKSPTTHPLTGADAVMVGASIHVNKHVPYVIDFVRANRDELQALRSAFFSVSLSAQGNPAQASGYIEEFCADTGWQPTDCIAIAGALRYTSYGLVKRQVMKQVARDKGLSTDTTADAIYTDWDAVTAFTERFVSEVTPVSG